MPVHARPNGVMSNQRPLQSSPPQHQYTGSPPKHCGDAERLAAVPSRGAGPAGPPCLPLACHAAKRRKLVPQPSPPLSRHWRCRRRKHGGKRCFDDLAADPCTPAA